MFSSPMVSPFPQRYGTQNQYMQAKMLARMHVARVFAPALLQENALGNRLTPVPRQNYMLWGVNFGVFAAGQCQEKFYSCIGFVPGCRTPQSFTESQESRRNTQLGVLPLRSVPLMPTTNRKVIETHDLHSPFGAD